MIERCPHCDANLKGNPIPERHRHLYGSSFTHFSRIVGMIENDRIAYWLCPDCNKRIGSDAQTETARQTD